MTVIAIPALRVTSRDAIDFYVRAFGAEPVAVYPPDGDSIDHAELTIGGAMFMCGTEREDGIGQRPGGSSIYWVLDEDAEVDALHARAVAAGAPSEREPYDADYGGRHATLRDLDGNFWSFGTYRPEGV
jgi:uncharacterized glyoxalase superfamily protein PhnB